MPLKRIVHFPTRIKRVERVIPILHTAKQGDSIVETKGPPQWEVYLDLGAILVLSEDVGLSPGPATLTLTQTEPN